MSPELIAPEQFGSKKGRPTKSSDCYALGMVIYETVSGKLPFHEHADLAVFVKVLKGERPARRGARFANSLWKMLEMCWTPQPKDRPSVKDVLQCLEAVSISSEAPPRADERTGGYSDRDSTSCFPCMSYDRDVNSGSFQDLSDFDMDQATGTTNTILTFPPPSPPPLLSHIKAKPTPSHRTHDKATPHFNLSATNRDTSDMQQRADNWTSLVENPDPIHTPGSVQMHPPHDLLVATAPSRENDIQNHPAADAFVSYIGAFQPPIGIEHSLLRDSHPKRVGGEGVSPQSGGSLIQPVYQSHSASLVPTVEHPQTDHVQLSRSGFQGVSLTNSGGWVRSWKLAWLLCLALDVFQLPLGQVSTLPPSQGGCVVVVPQRMYARAGKHDQHNSIYFRVNGRLGIPARDAIGKVYAGLEGRNDRVFVHEPSCMMLRLEVCPISDRGFFDD